MNNIFTYAQTVLKSIQESRPDCRMTGEILFKKYSDTISEGFLQEPPMPISKVCAMIIEDYTELWGD